MTVDIKAEKREKTGKLEGLRKAGLMPAVLYGHKQEALPIQIEKSKFIKAWKEAGESTVIRLSTKEGDMEALIHDVDLDPVTGEPRHADFYVFEKGHKVEIAVPIEFEGTSPAVKELGAVLVKVMHELNIAAQPKDLPHQIIVNIDSLIDMQSQILAKDIKLPSGVELIQNPEDVVAAISEVKEEVEEVAPMDLSQIEVEKKGKQDEEGAEGEVKE